jgi:thioredoxin reductase
VAHKYDTAIVGGGPAGLSAALVLARSCRSVVVLDAGRPRNATSHAAHNFLTREGTPPAEIRRLAREEVADRGVDLVDGEVSSIGGRKSAFELVYGDSVVHAETVLLATGLRDLYPDIPGMSDLIGRGIYTCPYCDGFELRGRPLAVLSGHRDAVEVALGLTTWSDRVLLCTHGARGPGRAIRDRLRRNRVTVREAPIVAVAGSDRLETLVFADGTTEACDGLFVHAGQIPGSELPARVGCLVNDSGTIRVRPDGTTSIPGIWAAGDVAGERQMILVAAASGARAATGINKEIRKERCR